MGDGLFLYRSISLIPRPVGGLWRRPGKGISDIQ